MTFRKFKILLYYIGRHTGLPLQMAAILLLLYGTLPNIEDTLVPSLAWPYYISQSGYVGGYKAIKVMPQSPCSLTSFLFAIASPNINVSKECSIIVWCDYGNKPGPELFSEVININVSDSGKIYWLTHKLVYPLYFGGTFWIGIWETNSYPTSVFDGVKSSYSCYSVDGINWDSIAGDYFYSAIVKYLVPEIEVSPDSLGFKISADTNTSDTAILSITNISSTCYLTVDSIKCSEDWVLSVVPGSFGLLPGKEKGIEIICGGIQSNGIYHSTLYIFSNAINNNPYIIPLTLTVTGYGVYEENKKVAMGLNCSPIPAVAPIVNYQVPGTNGRMAFPHTNVQIKLYDNCGRLVKILVNEQKEPGTYALKIDSRSIMSGIYFVSLECGNLRKVNKIIIAK